MGSKIRENCGLVGIFGHKNAAELTYFGLYALQHRGQESAGIVVSNGKKIKTQIGMGLVNNVFNSENLHSLTGHLAIGHVRYSTTGSSLIKNIQPFLVKYLHGTLVIAHNGNLINTKKLYNRLESQGAIFQTTMDSEIIIHLIAQAKMKTLKEKILYALKQIKGAYSLLLLTDDKLIAIRDPYGFRPFCLGKIDKAYVVASETCAFDIIGAKYIREIEPGEMLIIDKNGLESIKFSSSKYAFCIFEYIYFARPDSSIFGKSIYFVRKRLGYELAKEWPVKTDMVLAIPDSGNCAALGYAEKLKIPFEMAIIRNHYIGRTFIQPKQEIRNLEVKIKLNPVKEIIKNKKIVVIEDSIVRGTTSQIRMKTLKEAGAKEIHMRISCPPLKYPCFYGIDFPTQEELVAFSHTTEEIANIIGVDSLEYLSLKGLLNSMPLSANKFCVACFNGKYPEAIKEKISKYVLETNT